MVNIEHFCVELFLNRSELSNDKKLICNIIDNKIINTYLYLGWLIAYTYGSKHATNLQAHAGIIVTPGVNNALLPKAPINANVAYGVHAVVITFHKDTSSMYGICVWLCMHKIICTYRTRTYNTYVGNGSHNQILLILFAIRYEDNLTCHK